MKKLVIYGAKSIALGAALAMRALYPQYLLTGFLVSSLADNPSHLAGLPVIQLNMFTEKDVHVLIATPEDAHAEIIKSLEVCGIMNYTCLDWEKEEFLMRRYYEKTGQFLPLWSQQRQESVAEVYMAVSDRDKELKRNCLLPEYLVAVQAGAALANRRVAEIMDCTGENISRKNHNYCELTVLYWLWKNRLCMSDSVAYYGLYQYRRFLNLSDESMELMKREEVDVVLPYPTVHEPDISEHHARYIKESDWNAMLQALTELQPIYVQGARDILRQPYLYNYNILVAKREVLKSYCEWLFPILERTEELSSPKGWERADRYIGYLGENLLTVYFAMQKGLRIRHVGRKMLV